MPRFTAALAALGTVAFCIGFNTARYPIVWEMFKQPGVAELGPVQDAAAPKPAEKPAKRRPARARAGANTPGTNSSSQKAPKGGAQAAFCAADGICQIAGPSSCPVASTRPANGEQTPEGHPWGTRMGTLASHEKTVGQAALSSGPDRHGTNWSADWSKWPPPEPTRPDPPALAGKPLPVERPLVAVPEDSEASAAWPAPGAAIADPATPGPKGASHGDCQPLPPVDSLAEATAQPAGPPAGITPAVNLTTGYPPVEIDLLKPGSTPPSGL
ncbi:MAG: hypothetical protein ACUVUC_03705 [Thermoguttaceae bacterium]